MKIEFVIIFFLLSVVTAEECLRNVIVVRVESDSVSIAWDYSCPHTQVLFKVYTEHVEWKACPTGQKDTTKGPGMKNTEVRDARSVDIDGLHPYSVYRVTIKAIADKQSKTPEETKIVAETESSLPNVSLEPSVVKSFISTDRIRFYWRSARPSLCKSFNGNLTGSNYKLKGSSPWNLHDERTGFTNGTSAEFQNLEPYSSYTLEVFASVIDGTYNPDFGLNITERTLGSNSIGPPTDLKVERRNPYATYLSWLPPYPPTAEIGSYVIKWKSEMTTFKDITFLPKDTECPEELPRICFSYTQSGESLSSANLTFQVKAVSSNAIVFSDWTKEVTFYPSNPNYDGSGPNVILIVVVSIGAILFLVLVVTCVSYHCRRKAKRYKNVPDYEARRSVSFISTSTSGPPPPPYTAVSPGSSMFGSPNERFSVETTTSVLSSNSHNSFSLPTAMPRKAPKTNSLPRSTTKSQPPVVAAPSGKIDTSRYQHLLLPSSTLKNQQPKRPGSIQETPLPPVPGPFVPKEPIYEELCQDTLLSRRRFKSNIDLHEPQEIPSGPVIMRRKSAENEYPGTREEFAMSLRSDFGTPKSKKREEEEEFLKPTLASEGNTEEEDDDYLKPRSRTDAKLELTKAASLEDEYLKPTFGRFERIDSRDISPPTEVPPPIPMQSYTPIKLNKSN